MDASGSGNVSFKEKQAERMKRLRDLHIKRNEARQMNHQEVVEEDKRNKLPSNWEARKRQAEWVLDDEQYNRLVKNMKPDMQLYNRQKDKLGDAFYGGQNTILHGLHQDSKEGIDRMVEDLEKQISKREKYSRRRMHNDDADIDYINERNMKFNKKLERFYGEHTTEIKQNLERGTAV
ncbi:Pre-mRNA-splicing factor Syf2 [Blattella germanica]|nr:Pre-mRNA-splicing factor Syf2 [Blattella germanica]